MKSHPTEYKLDYVQIIYYISHSTNHGELLLQELPTEARTAKKVDGININLLSIGTVYNRKYVGVFKEKEMFITHKNDVEIKMNGDPMAKFNTECGMRRPAPFITIRFKKV